MQDLGHKSCEVPPLESGGALRRISIENLGNHMVSNTSRELPPLESGGGVGMIWLKPYDFPQFQLKSCVSNPWNLGGEFAGFESRRFRARHVPE